MPSNADLAARLLRDAAVLFRSIGQQNEMLRVQMDDNADVFEEVAMLIEQDPLGAVPDERRQDAGRLPRRRQA